MFVKLHAVEYHHEGYARGETEFVYGGDRLANVGNIARLMFDSFIWFTKIHDNTYRIIIFRDHKGRRCQHLLFHLS